MKILLNPDNGAEIKNVYLDSVKYFDAIKGETFKPGTLVKLDAEVADFVISLYGFLQELTKIEAKEYLDDKKNAKFICDECGVKFGVEKPLLEHKETHVKEAKLDDELGIPVIKAGLGVKDELTQETIDSDLAKDGITGVGLEEEKHEVKARFS